MSPFNNFSPRLKSKISSLNGWRLKEGCPAANNLTNKQSFQDEYKAAFRTQSYIEIWSKVQVQLTSFDKSKSSSSPSSSSSSSSSIIYKHIFEDLLEPRQETIDDVIGNSNLHRLLVDYFQVSLQACNICELILRSIHQARENYKIIKRVSKLLKSNKEGQCHAVIYKELSKFTLLKNPLSVINPIQFQDIHENYKELLQKMAVKHKRVKKRAKFTRFCKKVAGFGIVASYGALAIALVVIAMHSMVGILGAPVLVGCCCCSRGIFKKREERGREKSLLEKLGAQIDVAAKGLYILINDLDTMSRLVGRLHDEVEHNIAIANVCVRNNGRGIVLKQLVNEFHLHEPYFMDQLEELENHIYLCFLTINRSRRLLLQEIIQPNENK